MTTFLRCSLLLGLAIAVVAGAPRLAVSYAGPYGAHIPEVSSPLQQVSSQAGPASTASAPVQSAPGDQSTGQSTPRSQSAAPVIKGDPSIPMQADMKVQIIRYIDGEFARAAKALPGKTTGFTIHVGKPIDQQAYQDALRLQGTAIGAGDPVQITRLDFQSKRILIQLNGGAKKKFHLRDHLSIGLGGGDPNPTDTAPQPDSSDRRGEGIGAVIVLDYERPLPDVSPDDVRKALSPLLDFSRERSAAVNWVETLPPAFQAAVRDHKALPGMDQDTVIAAIGRPDKKVRQKNPDGIDTEDWIYGNPPAQTVFVTFLAEKVIRVEECGGPETDTAAGTTCSTVR